MVALLSLPQDAPKRKASGFVRISAADGTVVCSRCEVADRALKRMRGLLGRRGLEPGGGMLITPAPSVMTFFMRFPIDVVFLDRERRIVGISHTLRPWRVGYSEVSTSRRPYAAQPRCDTTVLSRPATRDVVEVSGNRCRTSASACSR